MSPEFEINEDFARPAVTARLRWWNPPPRYEIGNSRLVIATRGGTDFWQRTHYGFSVDNGHCLLCEWDVGDFVLTTTVSFHPVHQYDQAGLIVRFSPDCWLKTSVEFEPSGPNRLGVVVTNNGWSDWSMQDVPKSMDRVCLRVRREGADFVAEHAQVEKVMPMWSQMRMAHLTEAAVAPSVQCGLYACSPKDEGFTAKFEYLKIERGRVSDRR
jgi:regulation of enolase protein 1 (concanavalin A-like superfamily)